jgi:hypothetical protein
MEYIENLANNYPELNKPIELDIIIEGGLFNGMYSCGALLLIKELEKKKYFKVNRISGASIGSIMGYYYFTDTIDDFTKDFIDLRDSFQKNVNFHKIEEITTTHLNKLDKLNLDLLNDKLFITYIKNGEETTQQYFESCDDLKRAILKSIQIPYLTSDSFFRVYDDDKYLDGGVPFIFNDRAYIKDKYVLYLNNSSLNTMFTVKNEVNAYGRILEGALDAHNFFLHKKIGVLCSYIHEWNTTNFIVLRLKQLMYKLLIVVCLFFHENRDLFVPCLNKLSFLKEIGSVLKKFMKDFILLKCL